MVEGWRPVKREKWPKKEFNTVTAHGHLDWSMWTRLWQNTKGEDTGEREGEEVGEMEGEWVSPKANGLWVGVSVAFEGDALGA